MDYKALTWFFGAFITVLIVIAMIPEWHAFLIKATENATPIEKFLLLFFLDPTEYIWKWIAVTIIGVWALISSGGR